MSKDGGRADVLRRTLSRRDAVVIGMGSMIGAGMFVVWSPAAESAGSFMLFSLLIVAVVAACNAYSSAMLAARYPTAGGTYVYGTKRLGPLPGFLAGWCFIVGKSASCVAMALTLGAYVAPGHQRFAAVVAVLALTAANLSGLQRSARISTAIVSVVLAVVLGLGCSVAWASVGGEPVFDLSGGLMSTTETSVYGVLQGAGLLFFAFAGYARIATLGEEVRDPERTIGQAIGITFVLVLALYAGLGVLVIGVLGSDGTASSTAPIADVAEVVWGNGGVWAVGVAAAGAAAGALLNMLLGISRTTVAMARDAHLPRPLALTSGSHGLPQRAEIAVASIVLVLVLFVDLRGAIGFSSFGVLLYYTVANASAWTIRGQQRWQRVVPVLGLVGCLTLVASLPWVSVITGLVLVALGIGWYAVTRRSRMAV
ncbi:MAG: APC family permease [Ornithinimicrobium sp.]